jgi:hypothetical protein
MIGALVAGVVFENRRLATDWTTILIKIVAALLIAALLAFLPEIGSDDFDVEHSIMAAAYIFVVLFVLISFFYHAERIVPPLGEGITLLHSISLLYWILASQSVDGNETIVTIGVSLAVVYSAISIFHAFSDMELNAHWRLLLSIWSCMVMLVFGFDHVVAVLGADVEQASLGRILVQLVQYFVLGVSLIYIVQNLYMLIVYLPRRGGAYNKEQMQEIREMNQTHINRYSPDQIKRSDAILALVITSGIYTWNYFQRVLPAQTLVWLLLWTFPMLIALKASFRKPPNPDPA